MGAKTATRTAVALLLPLAAVVAGASPAWAQGRRAQTPPAQAQAPHVQAQKDQQRYALVVGNNVGNERARALRYAEEDVVRVAGLLGRTGDFDDVVLLRGANAPEVQQSLARMQTRLLADRAAGRPTLLFFYYSGHGDHEALELGDTRLPLRYLRESLEALAADVKIAFVDACHSGVMTGVKGGRRAPAFEVKLADPGSVRGMAIVTSSTGSELSQESDELKASFFSASVMAGLQGAADSSGDGRVTLAEIYQYAFRRTLSTTAASPVGGQHPTYDYRMAGTGDVILTRVRTEDARLVFPKTSSGTFVVLHGDRVMAEVAAAPDLDQYLSLPAGDYQVLRRSVDGVFQSSVRLGPAEAARLDPRAMVAMRQGGAVAKKGSDGDDGAGAPDAAVFARAASRASGPGAVPRHTLLGGYALQSSPIAGAALLGGPTAAYRRTVGRLELGLRAAVARFEADDRGYRSSLLRVLGAADGAVVLRSSPMLRLVAGGSLGLAWTRQRDVLGERGTSAGLRYAARGAATFTPGLGPLVANLDVEAGAESFRLDGRIAHRPFAAATLALGITWD
jgi:hypothetical protein